MAKRGGNKHKKRIAASKYIPITDKKESVWLVRTGPGPHPSGKSIPLIVLLREILGFAKTKKEARFILKGRQVQIDGRIRTEEKFPVGFMDIVSFPKIRKYYRILVDKKGRLVPEEIDEKLASSKIGKVIGKYTKKKGKMMIMLHDGKNIESDNNVNVGDSLVISIPDYKTNSLLKLGKGSRCLVKDGKHAGIVANVEEIFTEQAGGQKQARMKTDSEEFTTVVKHLCVVDESIKGVSR
ncbi:30S ribosomal protein S4e [Candidatus Micrarchaeota archaeon]|nr:30S ribosomal protein S4e [Candidatus Micrarchaeota archaeon]